MIEQAPKKNFSKEQKIGFVLLLVFGILAIGLGVLQMRNTIYSPFAFKLSGEGGSSLLLDEQTRLQSLDTDRDGLNDWEELNFYQTSPYLPDTDSDKISDKTEIDQGTDPLCPEGEVCKTAEEVPVATTTLPLESPLLEESTDVLGILGQAGLTGQQAGVLADLEATVKDPQKLRQLLLQTGQINQQTLDQIDDQTLLQMVQELLAEQAGAAGE